MNSIKIDWLDRDETIIKNVIEYNLSIQPYYIQYKDDDKVHKLYINPLSISCILISPHMEWLEE